MAADVPTMKVAIDQWLRDVDTLYKLLRAVILTAEPLGDNYVGYDDGSCKWIATARDYSEGCHRVLNKILKGDIYLDRDRTPIAPNYDLYQALCDEVDPIYTNDGAGYSLEELEDECGDDWDVVSNWLGVKDFTVTAKLQISVSFKVRAADSDDAQMQGEHICAGASLDIYPGLGTDDTFGIRGIPNLEEIDTSVDFTDVEVED